MRKRFFVFGVLALVGIGLITAVFFFSRFREQVNFAGSRGDGNAIAPTVPAGFTATVFAEGLVGPRFLAFGPDGHLYVAERGSDRIAVLRDEDGNGVADNLRSFATDLENPHSLVYHEDAWYVGVPTGVVRLQDSDGDGSADSRTILIDDYPTGGHSTRTVLFMPDGRMVVSVGSSCNVCEEDDPRRAAVIVYDGPSATGEAVFATGLRNAVGLALHPETGALWATNNGRDLMGDDLPPETVYVVQEGGDYGWPFCHNGDIIDPDLGFPAACENVLPPVIEMQAHSAPLGLAFYTGNAFPAEYHGDLFIAYHGSWNRSIPTGYKVVRVPLDGSKPAGPVADFANGWLDLEENVVHGRPVGLAVGPDGALYVSDDKGGIVYRIAYTGS